MSYEINGGDIPDLSMGHYLTGEVGEVRHHGEEMEIAEGHPVSDSEALDHFLSSRRQEYDREVFDGEIVPGIGHCRKSDVSYATAKVRDLYHEGVLDDRDIVNFLNHKWNGSDSR